MKKLLSALVLSLCATAAQAGPSINIGSVYDYMDGAQSSYVKRVYNSGDSTAFVKVDIFEMKFDAKGIATEVPLHNDGVDVSVRTGLVASPARLIVPAAHNKSSGMQSTRIRYVGTRDVERYYRVRFVPVVPDKNDAFGVSDGEREAYEKIMSAGVNIMTGYGGIFFVRPTNTHFDTKIQNDLKQYTVTNAGNSTIILDEFKDCSSTKDSDCQATRKHHVWPGKTFSFVKEPQRVYRFNLIEGKTTKNIEVKS